MEKTFLTGNQELIRDINTQSVIRTIVREEPISRAQIAAALGITKATVSNIVQDLLARSLILECGSCDTKRGRRPILLKLNRNCGYIVSADLSPDGITLMTSDLCGGNCRIRSAPFPKGTKDLAPLLIRLIREMTEDLPESPYGLIGIALGIHGVVHHNKIIFMPYASYTEEDLVPPLEAAFHVPVLLENEANLSVLGEWHHCHPTNELLFISIHSGIGAGIIMRDQLVKGKNGYAGEFGHTIISAGGKPCPCGNRGCLEQYASERAIFEILARKEGRPVTPDYFEKLYHKKDPLTMQLVDQFVQYMAVGINNMLTAFNPDIIVLNSVLIRCRPSLCEDIKNLLQGSMKQYCNLVPSVLQDTAILLGGVHMICEQFLYPTQIHS